MLLLAVLAGCGLGGPQASRPVGSGPAARPAAASGIQSGAAGVLELDGLGPEGAVAVIRSYYRAIDEGDYRQAYVLWENEGAASGQSYREFAAGFADTASVMVEIGVPGRIEGAAGSRYIDIPVVVEARTGGGSRQRFEGSYVLRRVVVDGATEEQRHWHLYAAELTQTQ
ncbi:MAG TPA: hypothetical protein VF171_03140 [Trueperaceae bacterium]